MKKVSERIKDWGMVETPNGVGYWVDDRHPQQEQYAWGKAFGDDDAVMDAVGGVAVDLHKEKHRPKKVRQGVQIPPSLIKWVLLDLRGITDADDPKVVMRQIKQSCADRAVEQIDIHEREGVAAEADVLRRYLTMITDNKSRINRNQGTFARHARELIEKSPALSKLFAEELK